MGDFLKPHTPREAGRIANAQAGIEYNGPIRELRQQAKGSRKREGDIASWYAQLASDYAAAQDAGLAAFKEAGAQTNQRLAEAGARDQAAIAELASKDAAFAALVGGPTDAKGTATRTAAATSASQHRATLEQPRTTSEASFLASLGGRRTASRMRGIEARGEERSRRDKILEDLRATRKEKGQARVSRLEDLRQSDRSWKSDRDQLKLSKRELAQQREEAFTEKPYEQALREQARLGLEGDRASAAAQLGAAETYAAADRRTARATEAAARQARRGRVATARGQVETAGIYSKGGGDSGGYSKREAQAFLASKGSFKSPQAAVNYLVNRGVKLNVARAAVRDVVGGGGGGASSTRSRRMHQGRLPQPGVPKGPRQRRRRRRR